MAITKEEFTAEVERKQMLLLDMREASLAQLKALKGLYEFVPAEERGELLEALGQEMARLKDLEEVISIGNRLLTDDAALDGIWEYDQQVREESEGNE